jgi:putative membrane protein
MKLVNFGLSIACAGALALTQVAAAQTHSGQQQGMGQGSVTLSRTDQEFLKNAAEGDIAVIRTSRLAVQKATNPNVKQYAQQQADKHEEMYDDLKKMAEDHNMTLPTQMSEQDQKDYDKLSAASGNQFDQDFSRWSAQAHQKSLRIYRKEAQSGQNPQLKAYASSNMAVIQQHGQTAQSLERGTSGKHQPQTDQNDPNQN